METLAAAGRVLGFSLTSGVNLYATVALLGLAARYDWVALPPQYDVFANEWIIGSALLLYVVEFVADKIPWVDSLWDSVHTFVRPVGGALVALGTLGEASTGSEWLVALVGGTVAAGAHLTKASTRVAANTSPEPFSNWVLSLLGDGFVLGLGFVALKFPVLALVLATLTIIGIVLALRWILRQLLRLAQRSVPA